MAAAAKHQAQNQMKKAARGQQSDHTENQKVREDILQQEKDTEKNRIENRPGKDHFQEEPETVKKALEAKAEGFKKTGRLLIKKAAMTSPVSGAKVPQAGLPFVKTVTLIAHVFRKAAINRVSLNQIRQDGLHFVRKEMLIVRASGKATINHASQNQIQPDGHHLEKKEMLIARVFREATINHVSPAQEEDRGKIEAGIINPQEIFPVQLIKMRQRKSRNGTARRSMSFMATGKDPLSHTEKVIHRMKHRKQKSATEVFV